MEMARIDIQDASAESLRKHENESKIPSLQFRTPPSQTLASRITFEQVRRNEH